MSSGMNESINCIVVLPRFPDAQTGTGQRSMLFLQGALDLGQVHLVVFDGAGRDRCADILPDLASVSVIRSEQISPRQSFRTRLLGVTRLLFPTRAYSVDPHVRVELQKLIRSSGARAIVFRYARTFCVAGIDEETQAGIGVFVDVDDRDDQKYRTRLERQFGTWFADTLLARNRLAAMASVLQSRLNRASLVWFVAEEDRIALGSAAVSILPNVPFWDPGQDILPQPCSGDSLIFVGIFDHAPNRDGVRWFLDMCWERLNKKFPTIRLRIVGRGNWKSMAAEYAHLTNVDFVGAVPDLAPEYARARVAICPVREGGGSKIKVVEACAFSRPVVATPHALRGFDEGILEQARAASDAEEFISACAELLSDAQSADTAGRELRIWQRANFSRVAAVARIAQDIRSKTTGDG